MSILINLAVWWLVIAALGYQGFHFLLDQRTSFSATTGDFANIVARRQRPLPAQVPDKAQVIDGETFGMVQSEAASHKLRGAVFGRVNSKSRGSIATTGLSRSSDAGRQFPITSQL